MRQDAIQSGLTAGIVGVAVSSIFIYLASATGIVSNFDPFSAIAAHVGGVALPPMYGWTVYVFAGVFVWSLCYAAVEQRLPGGPLAKSLLFGRLVWIFVMALFMPLAGHGFFAVKAGLTIILLTLFLHQIYGAVVGMVYASQSSAAA